MILHEMLDSLDIHLLAIGRAQSGTDWNYRNVNNFYNRIYLIHDGETTISHHGKTFHLTPGSVHLVPCYTPADYVCLSSFDHTYITFTSRAFGGVDICAIQEYDYQHPGRELDRIFFEQLLLLNPTNTLPVSDPATGRYRQHHEDQFKKSHDVSPQHYLENMAYINLMIAPFLASGKSLDSQSNSQRLFTFLRYVEDHLHEHITIQDIAEHLEVTPNYLSDWLAHQFSIRPVEYINRRRCEEAQHLLITSTKSIKEISYTLGFSSTSYFCRVFKAQIGVTAARYRALNH